MTMPEFWLVIGIAAIVLGVVRGFLWVVDKRNDNL